MIQVASSDPSPLARRDRVALAVLLICCLIHAAWILVHPAGAAPLLLDKLLYLCVMYSATLVCALVALRRGPEARAWRLIALGVALFTLGDTLFAVIEQLQGHTPTPSIADPLYLAFYPLAGLACLALHRRPLRPTEALRLALDVGITVGSLGVLTWYALLAALVQDRATSLASKLTDLAYPVGDLVLICLLLIVIRRSERRRLDEALLGLGLGLFVIADMCFLLLDARGLVTSGTAVELFWTFGALLIARAAQVSLMPPGQRVGGRLSDWLTRLAPVLVSLAPYLGLTACLTLLLLNDPGRSLLWRGVLWGSATVVVLVAVRQGLAVLENARLSAHLERRVAERTAELEGSRAQLQVQARALAHQAEHDPLTDLPNRAGFLKALENALGRVRSGEQARLAVLFLDLDGFKSVNDTLGHGAGDQLLSQAAARLRTAARPDEFVARLGGDEFMLLTASDPQDCTDRVLGAFHPPFMLFGRQHWVTASLGVSLHPEHGADAESLYMHADLAMYQAKKSGKAAAAFFTPDLVAQMRAQADLERQLRGARERGEFSLHYQPICDAGGLVLGFEALLRWDSPVLGRIPADRFIPVAEDGGLIVELDRWVLDSALAQLARWHAVGLDRLRVAVNISPRSFVRPDFAATVGAALRRHALPGAALELEFTERLIVEHPEQAARTLHELAALDVAVALDDFGTGQSALSALLQLPVQVLKIDRSFVRRLEDGEGARRVVQAIVSMAHALALDVVAEGVETEGQFRALSAMGCQRLQGFWLGSPVAADRALDSMQPPHSVPGTPPL